MVSLCLPFLHTKISIFVQYHKKQVIDYFSLLCREAGGDILGNQEVPNSFLLLCGKLGIRVDALFWVKPETAFIQAERAFRET